jgi:hypothetical protein
VSGLCEVLWLIDLNQSDLNQVLYNQRLLNQVWIKCESSLNRVWIKLESSLNQVWIKFESSLNQVWIKLESSLNQSDLNQVWEEYDDDGDEYKPVWPSGLWLTSQGGETSKAYNGTRPFIEAFWEYAIQYIITVAIRWLRFGCWDGFLSGPCDWTERAARNEVLEEQITAGAALEAKAKSESARTERSLNAAWMLLKCSLNVPWMFLECSLNVPWWSTRGEYGDLLLGYVVWSC